MERGGPGLSTTTRRSGAALWHRRLADVMWRRTPDRATLPLRATFFSCPEHRRGRRWRRPSPSSRVLRSLSAGFRLWPPARHILLGHRPEGGDEVFPAKEKPELKIDRRVPVGAARLMLRMISRGPSCHFSRVSPASTAASRQAANWAASASHQGNMRCCIPTGNVLYLMPGLPYGP
jgi:hypothetical protein